MGDVRLKELEPLQLERLYAELRRSGGRGGRQLSAKTVRHVHGTLHSALQKAARWKRLIVNPASMVELPKDSLRNNIAMLIGFSGENLVVPLAMKLIPAQMQLRHLLVRDFDTGWIGPGIELGVHF